MSGFGRVASSAIKRQTLRGQILDRSGFGRVASSAINMRAGILFSEPETVRVWPRRFFCYKLQTRGIPGSDSVHPIFCGTG